MTRRRGAGRLAYYLRALRAELRRLDERRELERRFPTMRLEDGVKVISPQLLECGENVTVQRNTLLHCGGLRWSGGRGGIRIGDGTTLSHNCVLWGAGEIEIGRDVEIGPGVTLLSSRTDFEREEGEPAHRLERLVIGDGAIVFAGATIGPGVTIGEGAVVATMAAVLTDVPDRELWGGVPARRLRARRV